MVIRMTSTRPLFGAGWALLLLALFAGCAAAPKGESSPYTASPEKARMEENATAGESPQAEEEEPAVMNPPAEENPQPESTRKVNRVLRRNPALTSAKGKTPRIVQRGPRTRKRPPAMPEAPEPEPPEGPESSKSSRPAPPTVPAPAGQTKEPSARAGAPERAPLSQKDTPSEKAPALKKAGPSGKSGRMSPSQKPGAEAPPRSDSPPSSGLNPLPDQASSSGNSVSPEAPLQSAPEKTPAPQKPGAEAFSAPPQASPTPQVPREPQSSPRPKAPPRPSAGSRNPPESRTPSTPQADSLPFPVPDDMVAGRQIDGPGEIVILLEGTGWVFRSDLSTPGNWRFLSRKREGESTRFDYYFPDKGHWNLVFTRQNLSSGEDDAAVRKVQVGPAPVDAGSPAPPSGAETAVSGEALTSAEKRYRAAQEASEAGNPRDAIALWEEDASSSGPAGRRARLAIVKEALAVSDPATLVKWLEPCIRDGAGPEVLAAALELLESQAGYPEATMTVLKALSRWDGHPDSPQWLYRLARKLEEPGENRNLDKALAIYRQIVKNWPFTRWSDLSEERILWLQQHYYRVR